MNELSNSIIKKNKNDFVIVFNAFPGIEPTLSNIGNYISRLISEVQNLKKTTLKQRWRNWRTVRNIKCMQEEYYDLSENFRFLNQWDFTQNDCFPIKIYALDNLAPRIRIMLDEIERTLEYSSAESIEDDEENLKKLKEDFERVDFYASLICNVKEVDIEFCITHSKEEKACFEIIRELMDTSEKLKKSRNLDPYYQIPFYVMNLWYNISKPSESDGFLRFMLPLAFLITLLIVFAVSVHLVKRTILFFKMTAEYKRLEDAMSCSMYKNTYFSIVLRRKSLEETDIKLSLATILNTPNWVMFYFILFMNAANFAENYLRGLGIDLNSFSPAAICLTFFMCLPVALINFFIVYPVVRVDKTKRRLYSKFFAIGKEQREEKNIVDPQKLMFYF